MILYMSVVIVHYGLFLGLRIFFTLCESLRQTYVFAPKLKQILNFNPSKRNKSTSFYRIKVHLWQVYLEVFMFMSM